MNRRRARGWLAAACLAGAWAPAQESARRQLQDAAPESAREAAAPAVPAPVESEAPVSRKAVGIGLSHSGDPFDIPDFSLAEVAAFLKKAGGTHYRPHCPLNEAVPEVSAPTVERLRRAAAEPALLETMIGELAANGRWGRMDGLVDTFTGAGLKLVLVVGAGYRKEAPMILLPDGTREPASPSRLGRDVYIAMARWIAGAAARRYGSRVETWQVENEINIAALVVATGWRVPDAAWADRAFLKRLLGGISDTVHGEGRLLGRPLKTTHNFATDAPPGLGWPGAQPVAIDAAADLRVFDAGSLDIIGIDLYANYFAGWPMADAREGKTVARVVAASGGRPVWVLEAGFPRAPALRGFSEARQGEYFAKLFDAAYEAGAEVVLAFGWFWNPRGWYTDDPKPKPWWDPQAGEQYWSPITVVHEPDGSKTERFGPACDAFSDAAKRWLRD